MVRVLQFSTLHSHIPFLSQETHNIPYTALPPPLQVPELTAKMLELLQYLPFFKPAGSSRATDSPFLGLPFEIRLEIYRLALPSQDTSPNSDTWANLVGLGQNSMSLLRVNRQTANEAREILYGTIYLTVAAEKRCQFGVLPLLFQPNPLGRSTQSIKHCQLRLDVAHLVDCGLVDHEPTIRDQVRAACIPISQLPDLQTLKVSFDCICPSWEYPVLHSADQISVDKYRRITAVALDSLRQLRVARKVTLIAAQPWNPYEAERRAYSRTKNHWNWCFLGREELNEIYQGLQEMYCKHWYMAGAQRTKSDANTQCQKPDCLAFVASFGNIKGFLDGRVASHFYTLRRKRFPRKIVPKNQ